MNDGDDGRNGTIRRLQGIFQFDSDATEAEVEAHVFDDLIEQGVSVEQAADAADFIAASAIKERDARAERAVVLERIALAEQMRARRESAASAVAENSLGGDRCRVVRPFADVAGYVVLKTAENCGI